MVSRANLAARAIRVGMGGNPAKPSPKAVYGEEIFAHSGGPRTWEDYIGQDKAKKLLRMVSASAKARGVSLPHVLIGTGLHGVGKSALARVLAFETGVGIVEVQGELSGDEAQGIVSGMHDGDILFIDEAHKLVDKGKSAIEWLLPLLQDGVFITSSGPKKVPSVTLVLATTDAQLLPETILSRLSVKPVMVPYSPSEATEIGQGMAKKIFAGLPQPSTETLRGVVTAANETPREISGLLTQARDAYLAGMLEANTHHDTNTVTLDLAPLLDLLDITNDGLDAMAQNMLLALLGTGGTAGASNLAALLGEPTVPRHTEKLLMTKGFMTIQPTGRTLSEDGTERALALAESLT